eukprot:TRINITY_DN5365_c0_g2_i1.p1 TRINITY_DN5365_c0_g2~~TRINITY_DN5365_c0_g2_i1.p1  ORF type:complete len:232 (+),score=60.06 TRINITY_DN5365_c0_g2_i1:49-744(+)
MTDAAVVFDDTVGDLIDEVEGLLMQVRSQRGAQRESTLKTAGELLRDCKKKWHQLKVEVRGLPNSDKPRFDKKVKLHSDKLGELNLALQKLKSEDMSQGTVTFSESTKNQDDGKQEIRNIHARTKGHQEKSLQSVANMESILTKTEKVAEDTTAELVRQGEVIRNIDEKLDELGDDITRAKKELNAFVRRMATDKLILCFLFLLVLGIVVAIVFHFVLKSDSNNSNAPASK